MALPWGGALPKGLPDFNYPFSGRLNRLMGPLADSPLTLKELAMGTLSYRIRSQPNWWTEYQKPETRRQLRQEALEQPEDDDDDEDDDDEYKEEDVRLSEKEVDYVLDELAGFAVMRNSSNGIQQSCCFRRYESDMLVPDELRQRFLAGVAALEAVPDNQKDWRQDSNKQVLDILDPSLHCLLYGRTLSRGSNGQSHPIPSPDDDDYTVSKKFAWIPTDFAISNDGLTSKALSYINNVPASKLDLYSTVEALVACFAPMFDRVLTDMLPENPYPMRITDTYDFEEEDREADDFESDEESGEDRYDRWKEWKENRTIVLPTVPDDGYTRDISKRVADYTIKGRKVQIFTKLVNIYLTPETPSYEGEPWKLQGITNEMIVASGVYCYASENVTDNDIAFQAPVTMDEVDYHQDDSSSVLQTWGLDDTCERHQDIGQLPLRPGRCVAFPNIYKSNMSPIELVDCTKSGHRKLLMFFLVHPNRRVPSTSDILPQQAGWMHDAIHTADAASLLARLPPEVDTMIIGGVDGLMTEKEAKQYRKDMREERKRMMAEYNKEHWNRWIHLN